MSPTVVNNSGSRIEVSTGGDIQSGPLMWVVIAPGQEASLVFEFAVNSRALDATVFFRESSGSEWYFMNIERNTLFASSVDSHKKLRVVTIERDGDRWQIWSSDNTSNDKNEISYRTVPVPNNVYREP